MMAIVVYHVMHECKISIKYYIIGV